MKKYLIIDGSNLLHRSYWVSSLRKGAVPVSLLFLNSLKRLNEQYPSEHCLCVWDSRQVRGVKNYRQSSKAEYKQNRDKSKNADVFSHEDDCVALSTQLGVVHLNPGILEADDYIAWLSRTCSGESVIISSDSDLIQLVTTMCTVYNPIKDLQISFDNFKEVTKVDTPTDFILYKSVVGDKSDNISGVPGYGLKRALSVVTGDCKLTAEQQSIVDRNVDLIDLNCGVVHHPEELPLYEKTLNERLDNKKVDIDKFVKLSTKHKLRSVLKNQSQWRHVFDTKYNISTLTTDLIKLLT
jgi:DNA polymerase I